MEIKPAFQKWLNARRAAQKSNINIPTRNANPTRVAGPKNSNGPAGGSAKAKAKFNKQPRGKG